MSIKIIQFIDIHSHIGFADYGTDLKEVLKRMDDAGVATITVGADPESSREAVRVANENKNVFACIGIHPDDSEKFIFDESYFAELVKSPKVVAIGECGLDYFVGQELKVESGKLKVITEEVKNHQKTEFIKQIEFAIKYDKPLMIHIRDEAKNSGVLDSVNTESKTPEWSAYADAYEILKRYEGKARGNIHFFAGSLDWAKKFVELDFTISFTGVITFARQYDEIVKNIPLEMIHAETDSPYVAPVPYRGKRNEPTYVIEVVKKIAEIRGEDYEKVRKRLLENTKRVFGISI